MPSELGTRVRLGINEHTCKAWGSFSWPEGTDLWRDRWQAPQHLSPALQPWFCLARIQQLSPSSWSVVRAPTDVGNSQSWCERRTLSDEEERQPCLREMLHVCVNSVFTVVHINFHGLRSRILLSWVWLSTMVQLLQNYSTDAFDQTYYPTCYRSFRAAGAAFRLIVD